MKLDKIEVAMETVSIDSFFYCEWNRRDIRLEADLIAYMCKTVYSVTVKVLQPKQDTGIPAGAVVWVVPPSLLRDNPKETHSAG